MANWTTLKAAIANVIKTNGNQEITGQLLQNVLNNIVSSLGENATFAGIATPTTNPGAPDGPVFYIASEAGTYTNFGGLQVTDEVVILLWNGTSWTKKSTGFATAEKLTELENITSRINSNVIYEKNVSSDDIFNFTDIKLSDIGVLAHDKLILSADGGNSSLYYDIYFMGTETISMGKLYLGKTMEVTVPDKNVSTLRFYGKHDNTKITVSTKGIRKAISDVESEVENLSNKQNTIVSDFEDDIDEVNSYIKDTQYTITETREVSKTGDLIDIPYSIKKGDIIEFSTEYVGEYLSKIQYYLYVGTSHEKINELSSNNQNFSYTADKDFDKIRLYPSLTQSESANMQVNITINRKSILQKQIEEIKSSLDIENLKNNILGGDIYSNKIGDLNITSFVQINLQTNENDILIFEQGANESDIESDIYGYKSGVGLVKLFSSVKGNDKKVYYSHNDGYTLYRFTVTNKGSNTEASFKITRYSKESIGSILNKSESFFEDKSINYRILIIGTSYSVYGYWIDSMVKYLTRNNLSTCSVVKMAVIGASLKDKQKDRNIYPYSSRPTPNGTNNENTFSSQIEKLKRLMAGTDLDSGEKQIYSTEEEYPNIIIIEGAANDGPDSDEIFNTAKQSMYKKVSNVYVDNNLKNDYEILSPVEEVDRTTFAGAYRYLIESLSNIFPNAQIFCTNTARLGYYNSNDSMSRRELQQKQQNDIIRFFSCNLIDWAGKSQINSIYNNPASEGGNGSKGNPYKMSPVTKDALDGIHPNQNVGGYKLGIVAGIEIEQNFYKI